MVQIRIRRNKTGERDGKSNNKTAIYRGEKAEDKHIEHIVPKKS